MKLERETSQFLLIDVQERLMPVIEAADLTIERCGVLLDAAREMEIPAMASEQYPRGIGATVAPLREKIGNAPIMEKMHFSCCGDAGIMMHLESLKGRGRTQCVLAGVESHVCVMQTALDLRVRGFEVYVAADAVSSRRLGDKSAAMKRLRHSGVHVITSEMAVFEWLGVSGTDLFRRVSKLVK